MADRTSIEWTESTWTPIRARRLEADGADGAPRVGWHCEHVSEGCRNCYAESINRRLGTQLDFKPGHRRNVEIFLDEKMLLAPLRWRRPRRIFVCSMTDLFADFVPDAMIDHVFAVMAASHQHTFQILTKRQERMRRYLSDAGLPLRLARTWCSVGRDTTRGWSTLAWKADGAASVPRRWPLPNVWLGVSAEDQATADARIPELLATPAAVRFVSAEPLLGPIDFERVLWPVAGKHRLDVLRGGFWNVAPYLVGARSADIGEAKGGFTNHSDRPATLDWIIVGGESGSGARPMHPEWARSIRDQCAAADVAFLFKQWGEWHPHEMINGVGYPMPGYAPFDSWRARVFDAAKESGWDWRRLGKKVSGRTLDGLTHDGFPAVRP